MSLNIYRLTRIVYALRLGAADWEFQRPSTLSHPQHRSVSAVLASLPWPLLQGFASAPASQGSAKPPERVRLRDRRQTLSGDDIPPVVRFLLELWATISTTLSGCFFFLRFAVFP